MLLLEDEDIKKLRNNMFRPNTGHHQVFILKSCSVSVIRTSMQTRIGVELSSPTCLIRYRLFYRLILIHLILSNT